jgi:hypothetical protein
LKIKLFPSREILVSDIPTGEGKTIILFYSVRFSAVNLVATLGVFLPNYNLAPCVAENPYEPRMSKKDQTIFELL